VDLLLVQRLDVKQTVRILGTVIFKCVI